MDRNGIGDAAKLVRLNRLTAPPTIQRGSGNIASANDAKVLYRNFSGRPDIYDDDEYYLTSKAEDLERRANARSALTDDDDILTDAVDIDAFQLPNKLWDEKIPNTKDGFILWVFTKCCFLCGRCWFNIVDSLLRVGIAAHGIYQYRMIFQ